MEFDALRYVPELGVGAARKKKAPQPKMIEKGAVVTKDKVFSCSEFVVIFFRKMTHTWWCLSAMWHQK